MAIIIPTATDEQGRRLLPADAERLAEAATVDNRRNRRKKRVHGQRTADALSREQRRVDAENLYSVALRYGRSVMSALPESEPRRRAVMYDPMLDQPRDMTLVDFMETGRNLRRGEYGKVFNNALAVAGLFAGAGGKGRPAKGKARAMGDLTAYMNPGWTAREMGKVVQARSAAAARAKAHLDPIRARIAEQTRARLAELAADPVDWSLKGLRAGRGTSVYRLEEDLANGFMPAPSSAVFPSDQEWRLGNGYGAGTDRGVRIFFRGKAVQPGAIKGNAVASRDAMTASFRMEYDPDTGEVVDVTKDPALRARMYDEFLRDPEAAHKRYGYRDMPSSKGKPVDWWTSSAITPEQKKELYQRYTDHPEQFSYFEGKPFRDVPFRPDEVGLVGLDSRIGEKKLLQLEGRLDDLGIEHIRYNRREGGDYEDSWRDKLRIRMDAGKPADWQPQVVDEDELHRYAPVFQDAKGGDTRAASKAGDEDRFAMSRNFLATDEVPDSIFGIPIVSDSDDYTPEDIAFFHSHPEAGGYYDLGEGTPEDGSEEGEPVQDDEPATFFQLNGNLKTEGRPRYLVRDDNGKVKAYGTQLSIVRQDTDGTWVAIPTIIDGREPLSDDAAFEHYKRTGEFFHRGKTREEAKAGADAAHEQSQRQDMAWWNNYIADHLNDGTLSETDEDMQKTVNDPGFLRWAAGQEKGAYERRPGDSDAELRIERRRRAILDGKIEPNAIDLKTLRPKDLNRARKARRNYIDKRRADMGPGGLKADVDGGKAKKKIPPIVKGPLHYGPPPPPSRGPYPGISNNPGNVEKHERRMNKTLFPGEVGGGVRPKRFAVFDSPVNGLNAAAVVLSRRAAELRKAGKPFTIENYAPRYAPPTENDTEAYIQNLSRYSGIARDAAIDLSNAADMKNLLKTVVMFESGVPHSAWFTDDEYDRAVRQVEPKRGDAP